MRLIEKREARSGLCSDRKTIITDDIASKAAGATQTHRRAILKLSKHRGAIRCLNDVRHMAGRADIGDADGQTIFKHIKQFANQYAGIKRNRFAGFKIDVEAGFSADLLNEPNKLVPLIIRAGDVMSATKVQPTQLTKIGRDLWLQSLPCALERFKILLTQGVEMQTGHAVQMFWPKLAYREAQA